LVLPASVTMQSAGKCLDIEASISLVAITGVAITTI